MNSNPPLRGGPPPPDALTQVEVVLHRPRLGENVGAAVRAAANLGLGPVVLAEAEGPDLELARRVAAEASDRVDALLSLESTEEALDRYGFLVATTARARHGQDAVDPDTAAAALLEQAGRGVRCALVFGTERTGLPQAVLDRSHLVSTVPTDPAAPSLNLAQAVLIHAWSLRRAAGALTALRGPAPEEDPMPPADLARLRDLARTLLLSAGYLDAQRPDRILGELERLLIRASPTRREGHLLLAMAKQLSWAVDQSKG